MKNKNDNFDQLAQEMAQLSCLLAHTCSEKETYFAATYGVTPAEFKCLKLFLDHPALPIKEISASLNITAGRITHILTSLEKKGYVTRHNDSSDKRNVIVTLTEKALPFIQNLSSSHLQLHRDILKNIDEKKREDLMNSMKELIKIIKPFSVKK